MGVPGCVSANTGAVIRLRHDTMHAIDKRNRVGLTRRHRQHRTGRHREQGQSRDVWNRM